MTRTANVTTLPAAMLTHLGPAAAHATVHDVYDEVGGPVYDDLCRVDTQEVPELMRVLRTTPGDVLELAAGAGRLTLPVLATGRAVTALELSATMLTLLEQRLADGPSRMRDRATLVHADMRYFDLARSFGVIILGTTSISLLDEAGRAQTFARVATHLDPDGAFVLSTLDLNDDAQPAPDVVRPVQGHSGHRYALAESLSHDRTERVVAICAEPPGPQPAVCVSRVRVVSSDTLTAELAAHGLHVTETVDVTGVEDRYRARLLVARPTARAASDERGPSRAEVLTT